MRVSLFLLSSLHRLAPISIKDNKYNTYNVYNFFRRNHAPHLYR